MNTENEIVTDEFEEVISGNTETGETVEPKVVIVDPKIKKGHFREYIDVRQLGKKNILRRIKKIVGGKHKASKKNFNHKHNLSRGEKNHKNYMAKFVDENQGQIDI